MTNKSNGLHVYIIDESGRVAGIDSFTYSLTTIDHSHHKIHSGNHFYIEGYTTLNTGEELRVKLVTPNNTKWTHFLWNITSNGVLTGELYEDSSGGMTGGSSIIPLNNNRNSNQTSGLVITSGVGTATNDGTIISQFKVGGTGFKSTFGGTQSLNDEIILKQNTVYLRKFISGSDSNVTSFKASWYEHTNKE